MSESYFHNGKQCPYTSKMYKSRVRLVYWEKSQPSPNDWYSVEVKDEDQDQWIGGLAGTAEWLGLIQQDIEWAWSNKKDKDNYLRKSK